MNTRGLAKKLAVAAIALAALLVATAPADSATSGIVVKSYSVSGAIVQVTIRNTASVSIVGTLEVEADVSGSQVWGLVPVTIGAGQTMTVSAGFTSSVSDVITVGMIGDDQTPI